MPLRLGLVPNQEDLGLAPDPNICAIMPSPLRVLHLDLLLIRLNLGPELLLPLPLGHPRDSLLEVLQRDLLLPPAASDSTPASDSDAFRSWIN